MHATCVAQNGRGLLILGASGRGKSGLALHLIALGAELVADDRVILTQTKDAILCAPPVAISGLIEARGVGMLNAPAAGQTPLQLVVDMDQAETERLPPFRTKAIGMHSFPLVHKSDSLHFPPALLLYLAHGRKE